MKTVVCRNPNCKREFVPDSDHRFSGCCSALCSRAMTPNVTRQRSKRGSLGISVDAFVSPSINRKLGSQKWTKTE